MVRPCDVTLMCNSPSQDLTSMLLILYYIWGKNVMDWNMLDFTQMSVVIAHKTIAYTVFAWQTCLCHVHMFNCLAAYK